MYKAPSLLRGQCHIAAGLQQSATAIPLNATCRSKFFFCGICHSDLHSVRNE